MPYSGWNGRFLGTGNSGVGGLVSYFGLGSVRPTTRPPTPISGRRRPRPIHLVGRVLTGHPEKQIDYAARSTNLMTVRSKQIIKAFYADRPKYSYFFGCSTGGGQGIHEALQFPGDYDGIVALAPGMNLTRNAAAR